ncbi:MAG: MoxR family ATPase, partial [Selenomonas sp.]|nr:MoxR family ATPase [Selenomonas sp.]
MVAAEDIDSFYAKQELRPELLKAAAVFRAQYAWQGQRPVNKPRFPYFGRDILAKAVAALLAGANLLLVGPKAVGKNILADNLAWLL